MKPNRFNWFLYLALIALIAEVVFLVIQNRRLQAQIVAWRNYKPPETLHEDDRVEAINLRSLTGREEKLAYGADMPNRLLLVFNTRCPACQNTLPIWKKLAAEMSGAIQILAVTSDSLTAVEKYEKANALSYPVFTTTDTLFKRQYKIFFVPQTILFDSSGTVKGVWSGALQDSHFVAIRRKIKNL